jgi:hypothetical protein
MFKLSTQQYAAVLESLQNAASSKGSDKRKFTRMDVQAPIRLAEMADLKVKRCYIALSRDISMAGIGLCQAVQVKPKDLFLASLPSLKQDVLLVCMVTFCRPLADGIYWVGAQFESEADAGKVDQFVSASSAAAAIPETIANFCGVRPKQ